MRLASTDLTRLPLTHHDAVPGTDGRHVAVPLTDQAIAEIKDLIMSGEFNAGAKLPREQDLAARLGLSRNSLREAVRALALIGVLDTRIGDGTYVTSLDADVLLTGMGFVGDLLEGTTLLEVHQVRRILEPVATGLAATRLTEEHFVSLEESLMQMDEAETTQAFIDADTEFHRIIVSCAGNATLASLIQNLSGGMMRARLWRTITEHDALEISRQRHRDIYVALRAGDAEQASAADLVHLADGERWLQRRLARGQTLHDVELEAAVRV
jgi:GntR family transcriptional regulator, transcriptional repressor for pyruvate dehydrogenase complex